jgi:LysR family transcriptional regulator, hydrogen peroxide-inducible genes activator
MLIYANKNHALHHQEEITVQDIAKTRHLAFEQRSLFRDQVVNLCSYMSGAGGGLPFQFEAGSLETLMNIVDQEGGITLIPELATYTMSEQRKMNVLSFTNVNL